MLKYFKIHLIIFILSPLLFFAGCAFDSPEESEEIIESEPHNPTPADNSTEQLLGLNLKWEATGPVTFDVYFSTNSLPDSIIATDTTVKNVVVTGLKENTKYYWRVVGTNNDGTQVESPIWKFTTREDLKPTNEYTLTRYSIEPEAPSFINILFQVQDLSGYGIPNLEIEDFLLLEDNQQVSQLESSMLLKNKDDVTYTFKTVLMLDNSASLSNNLEEIKAAAKEFIANLEPNQEVAVYEFSENPRLLVDFTANQSALNTAINSIQLGFSTTDLYGAVITGASRLETSFSLTHVTQGAMVLFTDGSDTQGSHSFNDAYNAVSGKKTFTVGFGPDIDPNILSQLGTTGSYSTTDITEITSQFLEIQSSLKSITESFYILKYLSPKRGNQLVSVRLSLKNNNYTGSGSFITGEFNSNGFYSVSPGIYVNSTQLNPEGISEITLTPNQLVTITAQSYFGDNTPSFSWSSANTNIASVTANPTDNSKGVILATGNSGDQTTIVIIDFNNNYSKLLTVKIQ